MKVTTLSWTASVPSTGPSGDVKEIVCASTESAETATLKVIVTDCWTAMLSAALSGETASTISGSTLPAGGGPPPGLPLPPFGSGEGEQPRTMASQESTRILAACMISSTSHPSIALNDSRHG